MPSGALRIGHVIRTHRIPLPSTFAVWTGYHPTTVISACARRSSGGWISAAGTCACRSGCCWPEVARQLFVHDDGSGGSEVGAVGRRPATGAIASPRPPMPSPVQAKMTPAMSNLRPGSRCRYGCRQRMVVVAGRCYARNRAMASTAVHQHARVRVFGIDAAPVEAVTGMTSIRGRHGAIAGSSPGPIRRRPAVRRPAQLGLPPEPAARGTRRPVPERLSSRSTSLTRDRIITEGSAR